MITGLPRRRRGVAEGRRLARLRNVVRDERGSTLVEFTIIAPMLVVLWVGVLQFGPILQSKIILQNAVYQGAQLMGASRTDATIYTDTDQSVQRRRGRSGGGRDGHRVHLQRQRRVVCGLRHRHRSARSSIGAAQGHAAQVSASYPCVLANGVFNFHSACTVTATESALIQ